VGATALSQVNNVVLRWPILSARVCPWSKPSSGVVQGLSAADGLAPSCASHGQAFTRLTKPMRLGD